MKYSLRLSILLAVAGSVFSGGILFWTSQAVQTAEAEQRRLQDAVAHEREAIRVLQAEWAYLTRPDRLEDLARTHLRMVPPEVGQFAATAEDLPVGAARALPGRKPAAQDVVFSPAARYRAADAGRDGADRAARRADGPFREFLGAYDAPAGGVR